MAGSVIPAWPVSQAFPAAPLPSPLALVGIDVKRAIAALAALVALATMFATTAAASPPDGAAPTPLARSGAATARSSISRSSMCAGLRARLSRGGVASGLFVVDASSGNGKTVCAEHGRTRRIPASNMKLFTTATALARFGGDGRLQTSIYSSGDVDASGVLRGNLYVVGGGDPALSDPDFARHFLGGLGTNLFDLTPKVQSAGIKRVTGRLYADDTIFDRLRGVADSGFATSPYIGPLSGLDFDSGYTDSSARHFASDPAIVAANSLAGNLRSAGVQVSSDVRARALPATGTHKIGEISSPQMKTLTNETDVYSNNFFAEMLLKDLGAYFGSGGTTAAGTLVVRRFVRGLGTGVRQVDGSGLTSTNRVTPAQVARLLVAMRHTPVADDFANSLPVAGREGTVAQRMRGTAAAGRCHTKTGTLTGVSALSGYCFNRDGKVMVFSILMNRVTNLSQAHLQQDRMAALIARY
jgi:D-alanyl-D-alanine carboxypeptidase/D-alanyl-D-alanine-endopeptidase (penicillin-binding protein 4)